MPGRADLKMERDHDQPLSQPALEVLERARALGDGSGLIFPSQSRPGKPLSGAAFMNLLKRAGYADRTTAHGFRATFRTWATECTNATFFPTLARETVGSSGTGWAPSCESLRQHTVDKSTGYIRPGAMPDGMGSCVVVEAAGIEPASASGPPSALHA